jgi:hypothetical protein
MGQEKHLSLSLKKLWQKQQQKGSGIYPEPEIENIWAPIGHQFINLTTSASRRTMAKSLQHKRRICQQRIIRINEKKHSAYSDRFSRSNL